MHLIPKNVFDLQTGKSYIIIILHVDSVLKSLSEKRKRSTTLKIFVK